MALPDLNRELQISVGTAGPQQQAPERSVGTAEPQPRAPDLSGIAVPMSERMSDYMPNRMRIFFDEQPDLSEPGSPFPDCRLG